MAFAGLADLRLFDNVSQYINALAGEFSPDTSHLHDVNCKCSLVDRLWCDYFGRVRLFYYLVSYTLDIHANAQYAIF